MTLATLVRGCGTGHAVCLSHSQRTGHARAYITYDVLLRVLRHAGYEVTYVRNFTDIDDKIIARCVCQVSGSLHCCVCSHTGVS